MKLLRELGELWRHRELLLALTFKDLKVRYKNAAIGFVWAFLHPIAFMGILFLVFGVFLKIPVQGYPFFLLAGLFPWFFLQSAVSEATHAIIFNASFVKQYASPRAIHPLSVIFSKLCNFGVSLSLLIVILNFGGFRPGLGFTLLPLVILTHLILIIGLSLIASSLHVFYRDVRYLLDLFLLLWMYASPVFYPERLAAQTLSPLLYRIYSLNPMTGIITSYRNILLDQGGVSSSLWESFLLAAAALLAGFFIFRHYENRFAEMV